MLVQYLVSTVLVVVLVLWCWQQVAGRAWDHRHHRRNLVK
jgi:hypothetical protein